MTDDLSKYQKKCGTCDKLFLIGNATDYAYKIPYHNKGLTPRVDYHCSYTCFRIAQKQREAMPDGRKTNRSTKKRR